MRDNRVIKCLLKVILCILAIAAVLIVFIGFYAGVSFIQEKLFIKGEFIIFLIKSPYSYLMFMIMPILASRIGRLFFKKEKPLYKNKCFLILDKFLMLALVPLIYIVVTSVVVVTKDGIYDYSFYNLKGHKYSFSDVEYVSTGVIDSGKNKGSFYYNIELENGKKIELGYPSMMQPSENYEADSWSEYVDIDKYIMESGARKESSENGIEFVSMDKVYVDKLLTVIRNVN